MAADPYGNLVGVGIRDRCDLLLANLFKLKPDVLRSCDLY
jgi:hypothetical protein